MAHYTPEKLSEMLNEAKSQIPMDSIWQHHKGGKYKIVGFDIDAETDNIRVHYSPTMETEALTFSHFVSDFLTNVYANGVEVKRFTMIP